MADSGAPEGNQNSTADKRLVTSALRRAAAQNPKKLKKACDALVDAAADGDKIAFGMLADRLDGRPAQSVAVAVTGLSHEEALDLLDGIKS